MISKDKILKEKVEECLQYEVKFEEVEKQQEDNMFKMRKLKEELEGAHIVKEQNLADKMGYIFHHN